MSGRFFPRHVELGRFFVSSVTQKSAMVRQLFFKKLGSSWIKPEEMEEKDATTYEAVPHPCQEKRRLYHDQKSLSLWSPWIAPIAEHPDLQLIRSGCHNWGSLGREGWL